MPLPLTPPPDRFFSVDACRVTFLPQEPNAPQVEHWQQQVADWLVAQNLAPRSEAPQAAQHYLTVDASHHTAYDSNQELIGILGRDGTVRELSEMADTTTVSELTTFVEKPYVCYPKPVDLDLSAVSER